MPANNFDYLAATRKSHLDFAQHVAYPFNLNANYLEILLEDDAHFAKILDYNYRQLGGNDSFVPAPPNLMSCRCGRISDACICCIVLSPNPLPNADLPKSLHLPIILPSSGVYPEYIAKFCFIFNYLLNKEKIRVSGLLESVKKSDPVLPDVSKQISMQLKKSQDTDIGYNPELTEPILELDYNASRIFKDLELDPQSKPAVCTSNLSPNESAVPTKTTLVSLCVQFYDVKYSISVDSPHKTSLTVCSKLTIVLMEYYVVAFYNVGCFHMHRGAEADMDKAVRVNVSPPGVEHNPTFETFKMNSSSKYGVAQGFAAVPQTVLGHESLEAPNLEKSRVASADNSSLTSNQIFNETRPFIAHTHP
ncbi:unnamed protein product, partial [Protopolystoma xenopodis]